MALGNWADPAALPALTRALNDDDPLVRGHAAWALGQIAGRGGRGGREARAALEARAEREEEDWVSEEITFALRIRAGRG